MSNSRFEVGKLYKYAYLWECVSTSPVQFKCVGFVRGGTFYSETRERHRNHVYSFSDCGSLERLEEFDIGQVQEIKPYAG